MKKIYILFLSAAILFSGCKKFIDVNDNPNNPSDVAESVLLPTVEVAVAQTIAQGNAATLVNEWMQNLCLNQPVPNIETYQTVNGDYDGFWTDFYVLNLNNIFILKQKADANGNSNYSAIAKILIAYCIGNATDLWGDVPYSQALSGIANLKPVYDSQESIYTAIQNLLDSAILNIQSPSGLTPGGDDFFYGGSMDNWSKLAYTLKARYYMHLTKAPGYDKVAQANLALTALQNGMQSTDDDFKLPFPVTTQNNPLFLNTQSVSTLVMAANFVDSIKSRKDPRQPLLLTPGAASGGVDSGRQNGDPDVGVLEAYSIPGSFYGGANATTYIITYEEALFLQAEATLYKSGYAAAQPVYEKAVTTNFIKLGFDVSDAEVQDYLAARGSLASSNALQLIMEEKSVADYFSLENYVDWRRTGYPVLKLVPNAVINEIPRRFLYPLIELTSNPQPQQSAKLTDRVWWDPK